MKHSSVDQLMSWLYQFFEASLDNPWFERLMAAVIFLNPVALAPQVWNAWTATSVEAISGWMWIMFAFIQVSLVFYGIKTKNAPQFFSMAISLLGSFAILAALLVRGS